MSKTAVTKELSKGSKASRADGASQGSARSAAKVATLFLVERLSEFASERLSCIENRPTNPMRKFVKSAMLLTAQVATNTVT